MPGVEKKILILVNIVANINFYFITYVIYECFTCVKHPHRHEETKNKQMNISCVKWTVASASNASRRSGDARLRAKPMDAPFIVIYFFLLIMIIVVQYGKEELVPIL
ncbi:hypothetical protein BDA99DRAFT_536617 [Phascolomyces articulosus]|uniref:Uncharacterized protein n=1 Tax=Phascolomyces articulosus TaxID=60185 RepID=A0AAD5KBB9_9FUNG|nr:hypothetical protein BDA99DRAFT_536617 [Phascolomyces articulosus]